MPNPWTLSRIPDAECPAPQNGHGLRDEKQTVPPSGFWAATLHKEGIRSTPRWLQRFQPDFSSPEESDEVVKDTIIYGVIILYLLDSGQQRICA